MKAGTYYVGDLCYVMKSSWSDICTKLFSDGCMGTEFEVNGIEMFISSTAYGDGCYQDEQRREYPVDSGTLGCVLVSDVEVQDNLTDGNVITFEEDFNCSESGGVFYFGDVVIDTADEEEEDDFFDDEPYYPDSDYMRDYDPED